MGFLAFLLKLFLFYMFFRFILRLLLGPVVGGGRSNFFSAFGPGGMGQQGRGQNPFSNVNEPPRQKKKPGRFDNEEIIEGEFEEVE